MKDVIKRVVLDNGVVVRGVKGKFGYIVEYREKGKNSFERYAWAECMEVMKENFEGCVVTFK